MANNNLDCPVDFITINENRVRLVALMVVTSAVICFITLNQAVAVFMLIDFILRAFNLNNYSPLSFIAGLLVKLFGIKNKPEDRAPKRFAAMMGTAFWLMINIGLLTQLYTFAKAILVIIMVFAALESFAGFCAGCHVYSYLKRLKLIK